MFSTIKFLFKFVFYVLSAFAGFLAYMTWNDYRPDSKELLLSSETSSKIPVGDDLTVLSWNIGYAGLDANMDFFYDGGSKVRPEKEQCDKNLSDILNVIKQQKSSVSFVMCQEIDVKSKRSYAQNQVDSIASLLDDFVPVFSTNYKVKWVPIPVMQPMGNVLSGIATYSRYKPNSAHRYAYPVNFEWPLKVFMLDRCFMTMRFPTVNGTELILINTHNSAFDDGGELRKQELVFLRDFMKKEYEKGNYVIAGGDFNQCPANFSPGKLKDVFDNEEFYTIPDSLLPASWNYVYDSSVPTNRRVISAYKEGETKVSVIDFFITSPNVKVKSSKTMNLGFASSDHNPIKMTFSLK